MSLFAFQDIITAVSGILILIVMLMILMLQQPGLLQTPVEIPDHLTLAELEELLADATRKIREFELLKQKVSGASEAQLQAEIESLESHLEGRDAPEGSGLALEVLSVEMELERIREQVSSLEEERKKLQAEVETLRGAIDSRAEDYEDAEKSSRMWLYAGAADSDLKAVIVEARKDSAVVHFLDDPTRKLPLEGPDFLAGFQEFLGTVDPGESYFVFFIRPDAIENFYRLRQVTSAAGISVGKQPIDAETEIMIFTGGEE